MSCQDDMLRIEKLFEWEPSSSQTSAVAQALINVLIVAYSTGKEDVIAAAHLALYPPKEES